MKIPKDEWVALLFPLGIASLLLAVFAAIPTVIP